MFAKKYTTHVLAACLPFPIAAPKYLYNKCHRALIHGKEAPQIKPDKNNGYKTYSRIFLLNTLILLSMF